MVELVYKFDKKSTASVWKGESTYIYTYILIYNVDTNNDNIAPARASMCRVKNVQTALHFF